MGADPLERQAGSVGGPEGKHIGGPVPIKRDRLKVARDKIVNPDVERAIADKKRRNPIALRRQTWLNVRPKRNVADGFSSS